MFLIFALSLNKNDKCAFKYIGGKQDNNTNCSHDMTWIFNAMIVLIFAQASFQINGWKRKKLL